MVNLAYGCCVGEWDKFNRYVIPHVGNDQTIYSRDGNETEHPIPLLAVAGYTSIAKAYNHILDSVFDLGELDGLVLLHDDLEITDPDFRAKVEDVLADPDVAITGIAGGYNIRGLNWWDHDRVGHQLTDGFGLLDLGERTGEVEALEGSFLVFSKWAIANLRFDEEYPGFHGYDDITMTARSMGKRVVVADIDTHHHTAGGFKGPVSSADWRTAATRWHEKWMTK